MWFSSVFLRQVLGDKSLLKGGRCHGTAVRRGDGVVITLVAIAFGILLVAVISCVGPRPLCNGHISQTCEQEKVTNK